MGYIYLIAAIIFEVLGTTMMKFSDGFTNLLPSIGLIVFYTLCFSFLTLALKTIDMSIAYATWCGIGIGLIALIGIYFFHEGLNAMKIISLALIIIGVMGLNLSGIKH